ncbi:hypothetical protein E2562_004919 [Oryza meyeriana var. granulata]|uniref:Uncharacterized protein n=1 Tax=Oryza meyeriana var. granulata TaxID=110450 RepID=A0A6G1C3V8_9ORYZ|nr:hypothetical protein E2562_004919 [Oryza meyeriana var. granulata]
MGTRQMGKGRRDSVPVPGIIFSPEVPLPSQRPLLRRSAHLLSGAGQPSSFGMTRVALLGKR